jgi:predicted nucleic acid-binding protein
VREWRKRYDDREVDFPDQTLVWLANRCRTNLIATTDFDDFETYRLPNGKAFKILIARP